MVAHEPLVESDLTLTPVPVGFTFLHVVAWPGPVIESLLVIVLDNSGTKFDVVLRSR